MSWTNGRPNRTPLEGKKVCHTGHLDTIADVERQSGSMCSEVKSLRPFVPEFFTAFNIATHNTPSHVLTFFASRRSRRRYGPCGPTDGESAHETVDEG